MVSFKTFGVKVNIYFMRIIHDELKILVIQKKGKDYWEFPNAIFKEDDEILEVCKRAASQVINHIHLGNFEYKLINNFINDSLIEVNYVILNKKFKFNFIYNDLLTDINWLSSRELKDNFLLSQVKFNEILDFTKQFVKSNYANIRYFISGKYTLSELQKTYINLGINNKQFYEKRNFRKWLFIQNKENLFIEDTGLIRRGNHRPAKLYSSLERIIEIT